MWSQSSTHSSMSTRDMTVLTFWTQSCKWWAAARCCKCQWSIHLFRCSIRECTGSHVASFWEKNAIPVTCCDSFGCTSRPTAVSVFLVRTRSYHGEVIGYHTHCMVPAQQPGFYCIPVAVHVNSKPLCVPESHSKMATPQTWGCKSYWPNVLC